MEVNTGKLKFNRWLASDYSDCVVNIWTGLMFSDGSMTKGEHGYILVDSEETAREIWLRYHEMQLSDKIDITSEILLGK